MTPEPARVERMKTLVSFVLSFLLLTAVCMTAAADPNGPEAANDDGFYIEEMPEFGQTDVLTFPEEQTAAPVTAPQPAAPANPVETQPAQTVPPMQTHKPEEAGGTPAPSSAQEPTPAPTPAPEPQPNRAASELRDNLPVMIVVAVVALSALAAAVVKKRKTTNRPPEAKRPNDIGGRK